MITAKIVVADQKSYVRMALSLRPQLVFIGVVEGLTTRTRVRDYSTTAKLQIVYIAQTKYLHFLTPSMAGPMVTDPS